MSAIEKLAATSDGQLAMHVREGPPSSSISSAAPGDQKDRTHSGLLKDLIQSAIHQAAAVPDSGSLWDKAFGASPTEQLRATLEKVQTELSRTDIVVQDIPSTPSLGHHKRLCLCERLAGIIGNRFIDTLTPPPTSASDAETEEAKDESSGTSHHEQASKTAYKRVDEM